MKLIPGNAQHIGSRQQQQDSFGFGDLANEAFRKHGGMLAVVADGMGGMAHGDAASHCALKAFLEAYAAKTESESIPAALLRAIETANAAVFQLALQMGSADDMGTTLIAAVVKQDQMFWVSAGDSGIFLYRDGDFTQVNDSHVFGVELDEKVSQGAISREAALAHPERESLTSFLGMERLVLVDRAIRPFALRENDVILLASDGLFKTLSFAEMTKSMDGDAQQIAEALVTRTVAAERQYQDNVTVVAIAAEKEKPSIATIPLPAPGAAAVAPMGKRALLPMLLALVALAVAGSYIYYMFSYDPSQANGPAVNAPVKKEPAQIEEHVREGEALDPAAKPEPQRQPHQNPPTPPPEPQVEQPPEQKR